MRYSQPYNKQFIISLTVVKMYFISQYGIVKVANQNHTKTPIFPEHYNIKTCLHIS